MPRMYLASCSCPFSHQIVEQQYTGNPIHQTKLFNYPIIDRTNLRTMATAIPSQSIADLSSLDRSSADGHITPTEKTSVTPRIDIAWI